MRLIDADALEPHEVYFNYGCQRIVYMDDIDEMPTIVAEPVSHGRWIECESENGIHIHKCSECGKRDMYKGAFKDFNGRGFSFYYKRQCCPYCGAKMDGVEE